MSKINVFPAPGLDSLFEGLAAGLRDTPPGLVPVRLVVPSVHFRDGLRIRIARRFGLCMGFEFFMPQDFVVEVFRAAGIERAADWTKRRLEWAILAKMDGDPALVPLMPPGASARDRFAMARALADRFDQYAHFRPEMPEAWARGGEFLEKGTADEHWQRALWLSLYEEFGNDAGLVPSRLEDSAARGKIQAAFPKITVVGSGSLDPLLVEVLRRMAAFGCRVDVHVALPCLGYLGDLRDRTIANKTAHSGEGDPENFLLEGGDARNPLLVSMGRHAAGAFVLLGKLDEQYTNWDALPADQGADSLLGRIQAGIRANEPFEKNSATADKSLSIHECFGPRRELEVLRDELLRAFRDDPGLKPHEVLIAAPSLDKYAPLVSAVFQTGENPLPVRLAELPPGEGDPVLEGLLALLEIARGGRGRASEVLDLLQLRAVRTALGVEEDGDAAEFLAETLRASGLTQGLHGNDSESPGGWAFSLDRLAAGVCFGPGEPENEDGVFHLPVADLMGSEFQRTNRFLDWLRNLHATLRDWRQPVPAKEWAFRLRNAAQALLGDNEENLAVATKCVSFLEDASCAMPLDAAVVLDWLETEAEESNRRAPLTGAILFGRLRQLHNSPCRLLALVGMQNEAFPSRTASPSWDLLRAKPKIWDRSPRVDDRQMFLDSLLAPAERLIITASTRNIRTNKNQPLSTCVEELVSAAVVLGARREDLVREHPLQPFSAKYFEPEGKLERPVGGGICELAKAANSVSKTPLPFHENTPGASPAAPVEMTVAQLAAFWKNPARGFLKAQKIDLPMDEEDDTALDFAPIHLDALQRWKLKEAALKEQIRGGVSESRLKSLHAADRGLPPGFLADAEWQAFQKMKAIAAAVGDERPTADTLEIQVSGCRILCPVLLANDTVIIGDSGKMKEPRHWLPHWLAALVAGALGKGGGVSIFYEGDPVTRSDLPAIDPAEAMQTLAALLDGCLQGQQRPIRFAPQTSLALLGNRNTPAGDFEKARKVWSTKGWGDSQQPGEGLSPAAMLAWRDADPFEETPEWMRWADAVSQPLKTWMSSKKK